MFKAMKNNKAADLQMNVVVMMLLFVLCVALGIDFWMASSTKILIIKETQSAEIYCLVKTLSNNYDVLNLSGQDKETMDLSAYQDKAVALMGKGGKTYGKEVSTGELYERINNLSYVDSYKTRISGLLSRPIGEMGIKTEITYLTKVFVRTTPPAFNKSEEIENSSADEINIIVSAKVVPRPVK